MVILVNTVKLLNANGQNLSPNEIVQVTFGFGRISFLYLYVFSKKMPAILILSTLHMNKIRKLLFIIVCNSRMCFRQDSGILGREIST